jgi:hypothetical protein
MFIADFLIISSKRFYAAASLRLSMTALLDDSSLYLQSLLPRLQGHLDAFRVKLYGEKCQIRPVQCGQRFLGQIVFPQYRLLAPENVRRFARRMRRLQKRYAGGKITLPEIRQSLMSWLGHAGQANTRALRRALLPRFIFSPAHANY